MSKFKPVYDYYDIACGLDIVKYLERIGFKPFEWQSIVCRSPSKRKIVNGSRQSGKSTISSAKPCHMAKYSPKSQILVLAPTQRQAELNMEKIRDFIAHDKHYPKITRSSDSQIKLANESIIRIVIATDNSARGYSRPSMIILDEASRIPDVVYKSGVRPMLTDNADCEMILISTPFGRAGFFYEAWESTSRVWDKYEVRSPWDTDPLDQWHLFKHESNAEFMHTLTDKGVKFFYSPRHFDKQEQEENLQAMGILQYRQEYCCEFVEKNDAVFTYADLDRMYSNTIEPVEKKEGEAPAAELLIPKRIGGRFF